MNICWSTEQKGERKRGAPTCWQTVQHCWGQGGLLAESPSMGIFYSLGCQGEGPPHHPAFQILGVRTEPELLGGVPEALHVGPPALEEVQLPGVPPLEDLERRWRSL